MSKRLKEFPEGWSYAAAIGLLHLLALLLWLPNVRHDPLLGGVGLIAYALGLRHAFDADHITAIDNTIRKLMQQRKNPSGVGFFFSLGHSSVVFIMTVITAGSFHWAHAHMPRFQQLGSLVGMFVSGGFLILIGFINLHILKGIFKIFIQMKRNTYSEEELEDLLDSRGFIYRLTSPLFRFINKSWHVYPLGFLFGLGFDTASEIAILAFSIEAAQQAVPLSGLLSLPILFASGMCLMDTADGLFMQKAYHWAFSTPIRKVYYNLTLTVLSVGAAFIIGGMEWAQLFSSQLHLQGAFWGWIKGLSLSWMGFALIGLFILAWLLSLGIWKAFRIEKRWGSKEV